MTLNLPTLERVKYFFYIWYDLMAALASFTAKISPIRPQYIISRTNICFRKLIMKYVSWQNFTIYIKSENEGTEISLEQSDIHMSHSSSINLVVPNKYAHWFPYWHERNCGVITGTRSTSCILSTDGANIGPSLTLMWMGWYTSFRHEKVCLDMIELPDKRLSWHILRMP